MIGVDVKNKELRGVAELDSTKNTLVSIRASQNGSGGRIESNDHDVGCCRPEWEEAHSAKRQTASASASSTRERRGCPEQQQRRCGSHVKHGGLGGRRHNRLGTATTAWPQAASRLAARREHRWEGER
uniref:Uncharacterized protein n=1 Tax=Leersia perrieri TaxID=77586 RepID=A0A0D9X8N2_9ORYZ